MKITYVETEHESTVKVFENLSKIKKYEFNSVNNEIFKFNLFNFVEMDVYENYIFAYDELPFIASFFKDQTLNSLRTDILAVSSDLNYLVYFDKLFKYITKLKDNIHLLLINQPDYIFLRLMSRTFFFKLLIAKFVKEVSPNTKIVFGEIKKHEHKLLFDYFYNKSIEAGLVDYYHFGYGEHFINKLCNHEEIPAISEHYDYTEDMWKNLITISDFEIKNKFYSTTPNMQCVHNCVFCSVLKRSIKSISFNDLDRLEYMTDYLLHVNKTYDISKNNLISSLPFLNNTQIEYFFNKIIESGLNIPLYGIYFTGRQLIHNIDLLSKIKNLSVFPGVEHFSDRILKMMQKPTTREINQKIMFHNTNINVGFFLIYNFFTETMEEFNELINYYRLIRAKKNLKVDHIKLIYCSNDSTYLADEEKFSFKYVEPKLTKKYFNLEQFNIFFKYRENHDPQRLMLKEKMKILSKNNFAQFHNEEEYNETKKTLYR